jgi:predicted DNA-binding helix-hairpin-helix protein
MLPDLPGGPPLLREHRLYQADWLMRYYGFGAGELLTEKRPNFNAVLDPKCDWAVHHMELFPVEVLKADYFLLLRVPGIGPKSAKRIVAARKSGTLSFEDLKKVGVVLKRAQYFITCAGKTLGHLHLDEAYVTQSLMLNEKLPKNLKDALCGHQMSLFELPTFTAEAG